MGRNYYDVLGVPKGTSDEAAIKKAYKKAALKFHPDRPGGDKVKFQEVSEAFEVLSDSKKKQLYDRYGEAGLGASGGATPDDDVGSGGGDSSGRPSANPFGGRGGGGGGGQTFSFSTGGGRGNSNFHGSDPFSVFESIFGTMDVDQAMGTGGPGGDGFSGFSMRGMNGMRMGGSPTSGGGGFGGMAMPGVSSGGMPASAASSSSRGMRQAPAVEHTLNMTLEELYRGTSKRVRITKKTASGGAQVDKTIVIKPGWKDGTRITFQKEGDEQPNMLPSDIVFVIKTKLHPRFKRDGNDLSCTVLITLEQALSGFDIPVDTLDGRTVIAREPGVASSSHETIIRGEGMPSQKDRRVKGDLTVRYCVEFPPPVRCPAEKRKRQQAIADL